MAHGVWAHVLGNASESSIFVNHPLDATGGKPTIIAASICLNIAAIANEQGGECVLAHG